MRRITRHLVLLACLVHASGALAQVRPIEGETLPRLLQSQGFSPPERFKALVIMIDRGRPGAPPTYRAFDWHGTADDRADWWPASTVKLFAAVAALEKTHALGMTPRAMLTYRYVDAPVTLRVDAVVRAALIESNNTAYDRLVEIVGFDELNGGFFVPRNGFISTVLLRGYGGRIRDPVTGSGTLRQAPMITLREGARSATIPERNGRGTYTCPEQGNCTSLLELAETMRRVMLHEQLPASERFALGRPELALMRECLAAPRPRGNGVVDGLRAAFGRRVRLYHKPGFALQWFSDVVFVEHTRTHARWIVAMAGYPGRPALDDAARRVGGLLASGALR